MYVNILAVYLAYNKSFSKTSWYVYIGTLHTNAWYES